MAAAADVLAGVSRRCHGRHGSSWAFLALARPSGRPHDRRMSGNLRSRRRRSGLTSWQKITVTFKALVQLGLTGALFGPWGRHAIPIRRGIVGRVPGLKVLGQQRSRRRAALTARCPARR